MSFSNLRTLIGIENKVVTTAQWANNIARPIAFESLGSQERRNGERERERVKGIKVAECIGCNADKVSLSFCGTHVKHPKVSDDSGLLGFLPPCYNLWIDRLCAWPLRLENATTVAAIFAFQMSPVLTCCLTQVVANIVQDRVQA